MKTYCLPVDGIIKHCQGYFNALEFIFSSAVQGKVWTGLADFYRFLRELLVLLRSALWFVRQSKVLMSSHPFCSIFLAQPSKNIGKNEMRGKADE